MSNVLAQGTTSANDSNHGAATFSQKNLDTAGQRDVTKHAVTMSKDLASSKKVLVTNTSITNLSGSIAKGASKWMLVSNYTFQYSV